METTLTFEEARVLGCLVEKEMATPEYYPLTVNSLLSACNQKSSRDPVVAFDTATVEQALLGLREKRYATLVHLSGARSAKHKHRVADQFPELKECHRALLGVLLLRGAQTVGELRSRSERLFAFPDLGSVEAALEDLCGQVPDPLAAVIPAGGGRHAKTFAHLLCGEVIVPADEAGSEANAGRAGVPSGGGIAGLERQLEELRREVEELRREVDGLKPASGGELPPTRG